MLSESIIVSYQRVILAMQEPKDPRSLSNLPDQLKHSFDYYDDMLAAERLVKCYEIAPPRVKQYLRAEVDHVVEKIRPNDIVLELGCGFGRVMKPLCPGAKWVIGIDKSIRTLSLAKRFLANQSNCDLVAADAIRLPFKELTFDIVICIQNGISAFHVDPVELFAESIRVTKRGGLVLFSSYSEKFWEFRLEWFKAQSKAGLIGELDTEKTRNGVIFSTDGFTAITYDAQKFLSLAAQFDVDARIVEVDQSSLFCEMVVH